MTLQGYGKLTSTVTTKISEKSIFNLFSDDNFAYCSFDTVDTSTHFEILEKPGNMHRHNCRWLCKKLKYCVQWRNNSEMSNIKDLWIFFCSVLFEFMHWVSAWGVNTSWEALGWSWKETTNRFLWKQTTCHKTVTTQCATFFIHPRLLWRRYRTFLTAL